MATKANESIVTKQKYNLQDIKIIEPSTMASVSIDEVLDMEVSEQKWLIRNLIPAGAMTVVSAPPNSFKTLSMTHLAICVATGKPLFGQFTTTKSGVLIVDEENGWRLVQQQLKMLGGCKGLPIRIRSRHNFKLSKENMDIILLDCKTYGLDTVIFDSLIDMHSANENDSGEMGQVMGHFKRLLAAEITVIVLHHDRKPGINSRGGGAEVRGSGNIYAQADAHISLKRDGDRLIVKPTKLRYAAQAKPFEVVVKYDETTFEFDYVGSSKQEAKDSRLRESITELLAEHSQLFKQEVEDKLREKGVPINGQKLKDTLEGMLEDELIDTTKGIGNTHYYFLMST